MEVTVLIVGDKNVGKTTFVKRHKTGEFSENYQPTSQLVMTTLPFTTNRGKVIFKVYDGGYPDKVDAAIIMFDLEDRKTSQHIMSYYNWLKAMFGELPVVVCGNKIDTNTSYHSQYIHFIRTHCDIVNMSLSLISAKSNYNFEKPFLLLLKNLLSDENVAFVQTPL